MFHPYEECKHSPERREGEKEHGKGFFGVGEGGEEPIMCSLWSLVTYGRQLETEAGRAKLGEKKKKRGGKGKNGTFSKGK